MFYIIYLRAKILSISILFTFLKHALRCYHKQYHFLKYGFLIRYSMLRRSLIISCSPNHSAKVVTAYQTIEYKKHGLVFYIIWQLLIIEENFGACVVVNSTVRLRRWSPVSMSDCVIIWIQWSANLLALEGNITKYGNNYLQIIFLLIFCIYWV